MKGREDQMLIRARFRARVVIAVDVKDWRLPAAGAEGCRWPNAKFDFRF